MAHEQVALDLLKGIQYHANHNQKARTAKELRKAHQDNDRAVMDAYGFTKGTAARTSESACVAELMKLYQQKVSAAQSQ